MSRIGKMPVVIPAGVKVDVNGHDVRVEGPKGKLSRSFRKEVNLSVQDQKVLCSIPEGGDRAIYGLTRSIISNMVQGVKDGYRKNLDINGVGYRANVQGQVLELSLGFSHPVKYAIPTGITIKVEKQTALTIEGADRELVGKVSSEIRGLRLPEPYKGKGIKYSDETIRRKAGKTAATSS